MCVVYNRGGQMWNFVVLNRASIRAGSRQEGFRQFYRIDSVAVLFSQRFSDSEVGPRHSESGSTMTWSVLLYTLRSRIQNGKGLLRCQKTAEKTERRRPVLMSNFLLLSKLNEVFWNRHFCCFLCCFLRDLSRLDPALIEALVLKQLCLHT